MNDGGEYGGNNIVSEGNIGDATATETEIVDSTSNYFSEVNEDSDNTMTNYSEVEKCDDVTTNFSENAETEFASKEIPENDSEVEETLDLEEVKSEYLYDLKEKSEFPDTIDESVLSEKWEKISPEVNGEMREEFGSKKNTLIAEWEETNGRSWPKYSEDVYSESGKCIRHAGDRYDAHHIHPLTYGGENEASNITPLHAKTHFDKQGVHSPNSPFGKLEKAK